MENLMEMKYVINGEEYLITVTKVEETNDECTNCTCELENEAIDLSSVLPEFESETEETDGITMVSVADIPDGISLADWLDIIREYNIILTK
jgi:ribosome-interacting GTPase 1